MTGTTSSTPEVEILAAGAVVSGARAEVPGRGDLRVRTWGNAPGAALELTVGGRVVPLVADADGRAEWLAPRLLAQVAGEIRVALAETVTILGVRPDKLVADAIAALVADLESVGEGLAQDAGALSTIDGLRSREHDLSTLDAAVGLAASAAPAIRRRPIHRTREVVRAVARDTGPRSAADVRWLATHPVAAVRVEATGRGVGVVRERAADLDTLENRGVLAAYDRLEGAVGSLRTVVDAEIARLNMARPAREAFLTATSSLWAERDQPRLDALTRRRGRLDALGHELGAARARAGLPDLRPRGTRMVRTARVDAEPAYFATFRAFQAAEAAEAGEAPPAPAPVRALDELWEQWVTVSVVRAMTGVLGPPDAGRLVDPGWFSTLRRGVVATWTTDRRTVTVAYEPEIWFGSGDVRRLHPGAPLRPDVVVTSRWVDGTVDVHVVDAKYRQEDGGPPIESLRELWWRYGDGIGDASGLPVVRSVWVMAPGDGLWLASPAMLRDDWPTERLRGGVISAAPGKEAALREVIPIIAVTPSPLAGEGWGGGQVRASR